MIGRGRFNDNPFNRVNFDVKVFETSIRNDRVAKLFALILYKMLHCLVKPTFDFIEDAFVFLIFVFVINAKLCLKF